MPSATYFCNDTKVGKKSPLKCRGGWFSANSFWRCSKEFSLLPQCYLKARRWTEWCGKSWLFCVMGGCN